MVMTEYSYNNKEKTLKVITWAGTVEFHGQEAVEMYKKICDD